jgi:two-component system, NtrC family, sensor histidine kinase HydH
MQTIEPFEMVPSVATLAQHIASGQGVSVQVQRKEPLRETECDPEQIKQLLLNLILNAIQATQKNGVVLILHLFRW